LEKKKEGKQEVENLEEKKEEVQCGICLESPKIRGNLDSCSHPFCFECIHQWSKTSNTCPFCKARFKQITKIDPSKRPKKVKVKHADQRVESEFPHWTQFLSDDEEDFVYSLPWHLDLMNNIFSLTGNNEEEEDEDVNILDMLDEDLDFDFDQIPIDIDQIIDLTIDNDHIPIDSIPMFSSARSALPRRSNRNTQRTSVRNISQPPPIEQQRTRNLDRISNNRRSRTQTTREQTYNSLGRSYRIRKD